MTRNVGTIDRLARGVVAIIALILAFAVGIGSVAGVILALVAVVMGVTAAVGFCPLYRLIGSLDRPAHRCAPVATPTSNQKENHDGRFSPILPDSQ